MSGAGTLPGASTAASLGMSPEMSSRMNSWECCWEKQQCRCKDHHSLGLKQVQGWNIERNSVRRLAGDVPGNVLEASLVSVSSPSVSLLSIMKDLLAHCGKGRLPCWRPTWKNDCQTDQKLNEKKARWVHSPSSLLVLQSEIKGKSEGVKLCHGGKHCCQ